jgi:hypothetical protein
MKFVSATRRKSEPDRHFARGTRARRRKYASQLRSQLIVRSSMKPYQVRALLATASSSYGEDGESLNRADGANGIRAHYRHNLSIAGSDLFLTRELQILFLP